MNRRIHESYSILTCVSMMNPSNSGWLAQAQPLSPEPLPQRRSHEILLKIAPLNDALIPKITLQAKTTSWLGP